MMRTGSAVPVILAIGVFVILLAPLTIRAINGWPVMPGQESYNALLHVRGAGAPTPYDALLAGSLVFGIGWLLPSLIGALVVVMLYLLLRRPLGTAGACAGAAAFAITPAFLLAGTRHEPALLALAFLGSALLVKRRAVLRGAIVAAGIITSPIIGVLGAAALLAFRPRDAAVWIVGALAAGAWHVAWAGSLVSVPFAVSFVPVAELGVPGGISVFFIILGAFGASRAKRPLVTVTILIAAFAVAVAFPDALLLPSAVVAVIASRGVLGLWKDPWQLDPLRHLFLVLIACAGVLIVITAVRAVSTEQPSDRLVDVLSYIGSQRRPGGILTDPSLAPVVSYYSGRQPTLGPGLSEEEIREVFLMRNANSVYDLLERTDTSFVLVTAGMRDRIFTRSDEGLLFLLPNTERFVPITSDDELTLWYYIRRQRVTGDG